MTQKSTLQNLLPTRFRLCKDALEKKSVYVFTSTWWEEANNVAKELSQDNSLNAKTGFFNQAVTSLSPVLVHGFKKTNVYPQPSLFQMLALNQYPGENLINSLACNWADIWLETTFSSLSSVAIKNRSEKLYDLIHASNEKWVEKNLLEALSDGKNSLRYSALPSFIAAQFASCGSTTIFGREIKWGLIQQDDNGLAAVSEPQRSEKGHTFAYLIRFALQYQPGSKEPWIHTFITCQRYMDEPMVSGNKDRNATILLRFNQPLNPEWAHNTTLVRLPVWNTPRKTSTKMPPPIFPEGFHSLLDRAQAREIIQDPSIILNDPLRFRNPNEDNYFVLYAEGYEPGHPLGSGFGARERTEIFRVVEDRLDAILVPGSAVKLIKGACESKALAPWKNTETKSPIDPIKNRDARLSALISAAQGRKVKIILASYSRDMGKAMKYFVEKRHFKLIEDDQWPDQVSLKEIVIPDNLFRPLEIIEKAGQKKSESRVEAEQRLAAEWQKFLHQYKDIENEKVLAWIEIPDSSDYLSPHDAIRMACVKEGILSQMIKPLRSDYNHLIDMGRNSLVRKAVYDFGRLYNACSDLVLRQAGVTSGNLGKCLQDDYISAGFSSKTAQEIVVIGITIFRNNQDFYHGRGSVCLPVAVRILANGCVEAKIPSVCDWVDYYDAAIALGKVFIQNRRKASFSINTPIFEAFIKKVLAEHREIPTLLILDAYKLRTIWKYLKVEELDKDRLLLGGDSFEPYSFVNMNVVWLRQHNDGETPQYVATNESSWSEADDADRVARSSLFIDTDAGGILQHYFSVGRLDNNKKADQKAMRFDGGGEMNFRNQQMLELVPVMGDDPEASVAITHMLRSSPAWSTGNTLLPYPIHLANTLIEDMLPLLGVEDQNDLES